MITVQLLGGACLRSGDIPLAGPPAQRHRIALLALIATAYPQPLTRDRAMAMLWPEKDVASARRLLNLAVHVLRAALGEGAINSTGDGLLLSPSHIDCDLYELRKAIEADASERVVRLYTAPLLDGFHLDDSSEFAYWLDERRNELSHAYAGALLTLAERQERAKEHHARVRTCMRLVVADPHSGRYAQALMRALDDAGDRHSALQHASEHARRRKADLDLDSDPTVDALAEALRRAPPRKAAPVVDAQPSTPSVAVLPFVSLSTDTRYEYFADGLTEDIIAHLSKIHALRVISRTSVIPFRQRHFSIKEIADTLRCTTILDGTIRYADDRVRIVAHLVDVRTERQLWAETYDRQLIDIFSIQTEVALRIAGALKAELSREEERRVLKPRTQNIHAHRYYQQGKTWYVKYNPEAYLRAIHYFDLALGADPSFALAHAMRAMVYVELAEAGNMAPEIAFLAATAAGKKALELDPELGEAHCVAGYLSG
ncbi:MAG TPA: BTAD domain-containing putative transcriptional regulator, partial [Gemmatimonadaceae bacterium]